MFQTYSVYHQGGIASGGSQVYLWKQTYSVYHQGGIASGGSQVYLWKIQTGKIISFAISLFACTKCFS